MILDQITNKNDEFYTPRYAVKPLLKYVNKNMKVWCPFDTHRSLIVDELKNHGNEVVYTHLEMGCDFFKTNVQCDVIISNPPYSLKGEVFERLFSLQKPFAMLVGVVGIFESQHRFDMFKNNTFEIMYMNRRISYFKNYDDEKPSLNPPFSSVWICSNLLPQKIIFEEILKGKK